MDLHMLVSSGLDYKLRCFVCDNYLSYFPISLCCNNQALCGRCTVPEAMICYQDESLEAMCQFLRFPCRYRSAGCSLELTPVDVPAHEEICAFRLVDCIVTPCSWVGALSTLLSHCKNEHSELFLTNGEFELDLTSPHQSMSLLEHDNSIVIFSRKFDCEENILSCTLYYQGSVDNACQVSVKCENTTLLHDFSTKRYEGTTFTEVCLQSLAKHGKAVLGRINIYKESEKLRTLAAKDISILLQFLQCDICHNFVAPPIFRRGKTRAPVCINCRESLSDDEEHTVPKTYRDCCLDALALAVSYPCKYEEYGCTYNAHLIEMKIHQMMCDYEAITCKFAKDEACKWKGLKKDMYHHILSAHDSLLHNVENELKLSSKDTEVVYRVIDFSGHLFKLSYFVDTDSFKWCVQMITTDKGNYKFEIDVVDASKKGQRFTLRMFCTPMVEGQDPFLDSKNYCCLQKDQVYLLSQVQEEESDVSFKLSMLV